MNLPVNSIRLEFNLRFNPQKELVYFVFLIEFRKILPDQLGSYLNVFIRAFNRIQPNSLFIITPKNSFCQIIFKNLNFQN